MDTQVVKAAGSGRAILYEINRIHPLASSIIELFVQEFARTRSVLDRIRTTLDEANPTPIAAWIYGSVASGEDKPGSDFDIALVFGDDEQVEDATESVRRGLVDLAKEQLLQFSVSGFSNADVRRLGATDDPFWRALVQHSIVLRGPHPEKAYRAAARPGHKLEQ